MGTWRDRGEVPFYPRPSGFGLGRWWGVPVRFYPLGIALAALLFGRFRFAPGVWLGLPLIVLVHELGHAAMVRAFRKKVVGIEIRGAGGLCLWSGEATPLQRSWIAWGGVLAQAALYGVALAGAALLGPLSGEFAAQLFNTLTTTNFWLALWNLIPVPPLDGVEAWKLPALLSRRYSGYWRRQVAIARATATPPARQEPEPPPPPRDFDDSEIPESFRVEVNAMLDRVLRDSVREEKEK